MMSTYMYEYYVCRNGIDVNGRMAVLRLKDGGLWVQSPVGSLLGLLVCAKLPTEAFLFTSNTLAVNFFTACLNGPSVSHQQTAKL